MQNIVLVPHLYYRNWDQTQISGPSASGELWLVLRPHIHCGKATEAAPLGDELERYIDWAIHSSDSGKAGEWNFRYLRPDQAGCSETRSDAATRLLLPINLPSDVDIEIAIGRGANRQSQVFARSRNCIMRSPEKDGKAGTFGVFSKSFNDKFTDQLRALMADTTTVGKSRVLAAIHSFTQLLDAGQRISYSTATNAANEMQSPFPGAIPALGKDGSSDITSLYWCLGLMCQLGTQKNLDELRNIDSIEIALSAAGQEIDRLFFPDLNRGMDNSALYFSQIGIDFVRQLDVKHQDRARELYVTPEFRSLQRSSGRDDIWLMETSAGNSSLPADAGIPKAIASTRAPMLGRLSLLAGIEARAALRPGRNGDPRPQSSEAIGDSLAFEPGILVGGSVAPYRKYPVQIASADGSMLTPTVMVFKPDQSSESLLDMLYRTLSPKQFSDQFMVPASKENGDLWTLTLLHAGVLPWDGPLTSYRVLAIPAPGATAKKGEAVTCAGFSTTLFFSALAENTGHLQATAVGTTNGSEATSRHLWSAPDSAADAQGLVNFWAQRATWAAALPINAIRVRGMTPKADAGLHLVFLDQYAFLPAESVVRMEQMLTLTAGPLARACNADWRTPAEDYRDDLVNFNTAYVLGPDNQIIGKDMLRTPLATTYQEANDADCHACREGLVNRRQTIPILQGWPRDPRDPLQASAAADTSNWDQIRLSVARLYGHLPAPDDDRFSVEIENCYGDRIRAVDTGTGRAVEIIRSARLDWPVELPTAPDERTPAQDALRQVAEPTGGFLYCAYLLDGISGKDVLKLTFNEQLLLAGSLNPHSPVSPDKHQYALALSAWRALAEMADRPAGEESPEIVVAIETVTFDVPSGLKEHAEQIRTIHDQAPDPAKALALAPFSNAWAKCVTRHQPVIVPRAELTRLRRWATDLVLGRSLPKAGISEPFMLLIGGEQAIGDQANLSQATIQITRPSRIRPLPVPERILLPISQQPGLFRVAAQTLQRAWSDRGFGPAAPPLSEQMPIVGDYLGGAHRTWLCERQTRKDSINFDWKRSTTGNKQADPNNAASALLAALPGSDWFPPEGAGPMDQTTKQLRPVLLPIGFAPCRPNNKLGNNTQQALENFARALQDMLDLAYPSWMNRTAEQWRDHFEHLSALIPYDPQQEEWGGRIGLWARVLTENLLLPQVQVEATATNNSVEVNALASAMRNRTGHFAWLRRAIRQKLICNPALFTDSKALLLTVMQFAETKGDHATPKPGAIAGARFTRQIDHMQGSLPTAITSKVSLADLVLADPAGGMNADRALGFLEPLDWVRYGNSFLVTSTDGPGMEYLADSFETVVDPAGGGRGQSWPQQPLVLPLQWANAGGERRLHLASRHPVAAPSLMWAGQNRTLITRLADTSAGTRRWTMDELYGRASTGNPTGTTIGMRMVTRMSHATPAVSGIYADKELSFALYAVQGDDESGGSALQSLENDGFFISLSTLEISDASVSSRELSHLSETLLRNLIDSAPGSASASEAIAGLLNPKKVDDSAFEQDIALLCQTQKIALPDSRSMLIKLDEKNNAVLLVPSAPQGAIKDAAAFQPEIIPAIGPGALQAKTLYLLIAFETTIWHPQDLSLQQGRNLPYDVWMADDRATTRPRFAEEFWMSSSQSAAPTRFALSKHAANQAVHWLSRAGHVVRLGSAWRGTQSLTALMKRLLLTKGVRVNGENGDYGGPIAILSDGASAMWVDNNLDLSVTVYHEQFEDDPDSGALPVSRYPLRVFPETRGVAVSEVSSTEWFPAAYLHFSIDFQWYSRSGVSLLRLERIFVRFD